MDDHREWQNSEDICAWQWFTNCVTQYKDVSFYFMSDCKYLEGMFFWQWWFGKTIYTSILVWCFGFYTFTVIQWSSKWFYHNKKDIVIIYVWENWDHKAWNNLYLHPTSIRFYIYSNIFITTNLELLHNSIQQKI